MVEQALAGPRVAGRHTILTAAAAGIEPAASAITVNLRAENRVEGVLLCDRALPVYFQNPEFTDYNASDDKHSTEARLV